jgi:S-DNA-T family DNA segregation ATPase FtsK/SpoIIIE
VTTENPDNGSGEVSNVHYLPAGRVDHAREVLDAELVSDEEYARLTSQKEKAIERYRGYGQDMVTVLRWSRRAATHDRTKATAKAVLRNVLYVPAGAGVLLRRLWEAKTNSRYERMMRRAEVAGDYEALGDWEQRAEQARQRRHDRVMDWLAVPWQLFRALVASIVGFVFFLLFLGVILALAADDFSRLLAPTEGVLSVIEWTAWLVAVVWGPLILVGPWVGLLYLWHLGRRSEVAALGWLRSTDQEAQSGALVTADAIVQALQHLNIPAMTRAFKGGWLPRFDLTPTREGQGAFKGYRAIFDLPLGVTPDMVADKGNVLATNLLRNAVEVWPSDYGKEKGGKPGYVNLYVADAGVMDKPTPEYPLMHTGVGDVFAGVPVGITQRGDVVTFVLFGGNFVFGGQPGQGKSNAARVVMAGAALDPLCELRVHVFAGNGDFDAYTKRLSRYHKGATPEHAAIAADHLRELFDEVERRENRLAELGAKKLTRALAEQHQDMRPIVAMFSECHELFGDKDCGEEAAELAIRVVKRGRKTGVITGYDTQSSRTDAIPSQLVENVGINGCFAVKTWRSNDGFLGDGSFAAGIRATELRFNVDRGTMVVTGVSDELFEIVRTFFIEVDDDTGWDAAADIIDRAMAQLARGTVVAGNRPMPQLEAVRELLDDLDEVLGTNPVPAGEVIGALRTLAPTWRPYKELTVPKLVAALTEFGIKVPATKNKYPVDPVTVREAIAGRVKPDVDDETT